jgi:hypothetical protein
MSDLDKAACERAIAMMQAEPAGSHGRVLIDALLARGGSFEEIGKTAAFHCQSQNLRLKPWQPPPMEVTPRVDGVDDGNMGWHRAQQLAYRLLAAGLSKYEPDPVATLERAERESAA